MKALEHGLHFHHVGELIDDMEFSRTHYAKIFGKEALSQVFQIESQKVVFVLFKHNPTPSLSLFVRMKTTKVFRKCCKKTDKVFIMSVC